MKKYFVVSLIKNGILGGAITADSEALTYRTGKLTIPEKYRNLTMKYGEIADVKKGLAFILPTVTIKMNDGEEYSFVTFFNRKRLLNVLKSMGVGE